MSGGDRLEWLRRRVAPLGESGVVGRAWNHDGVVRARRTAARTWAQDAVKVVVTMALIYLGFFLVGDQLGYGVNSHANVLRRVTFLAAAYGLAVLALNLHWGYTGLFNIGVAGFMAVGVYGMAIATGSPTGTYPGLGLPLWAGIIIGMAAAALVGLVAALPALRLRADYLAIVTIAISEIIRYTLLARAFQKVTVFGVTVGTGGARGLGSYEDPETGILSFLTNNPVGDAVFGPLLSFLQEQGVTQPVAEKWLYALVLVAFVGAFYWLLQRIGNSPFGRVLKAIREDEEVASALGKDTRLFKIKAFMVGCALMGLSGILWQASTGFVNPDAFLPQVTFFIWIALIIGGAGSNTGSVLGGALFAALLFEGPRIVVQLARQKLSITGGAQTSAAMVQQTVQGDLAAPVAYAFANIDAVRLVLVGLVLIWLMQNRPEGLLGHRMETAAAIDLTEPRPGRTADRSAAATDGGDRR